MRLQFNHLTILAKQRNVLAVFVAGRGQEIDFHNYKKPQQIFFKNLTIFPAMIY